LNVRLRRRGVAEGANALADAQGRCAVRRYLITAIVVVAAVAGLAMSVDALRSRAPRLTQAQLYLLATSSPSGRFSRFPAPHRVQIAHVDENTVQLALYYVIKSRGLPATTETAGRFDSDSGVVNILSKEVSFEASLPAGMRPDFEHTLRHEYGHAFLHDWLLAHDDSGARGTQLAELTRATNVQEDAGRSATVRSVLREYRTVRPTIYGDTYFTSTFGEFVAESYAYYCEGRNVPSSTAAFLASCIR
jgi:hypothetical protein